MLLFLHFAPRLLSLLLSHTMFLTLDKVVTFGLTSFWQTIILAWQRNRSQESIVVPSAVDHEKEIQISAPLQFDDTSRRFVLGESLWFSREYPMELPSFLSRQSRKWLQHIIILSSIIGAPRVRSSSFYFLSRRLSLKGIPRKINIIFLHDPLFFPSLFFLPALTSYPSPTASRVPGRMIVMSSRANEVKLERFNIVLTSIPWPRENPLTRWNCKLYQFNFMRTLSRTFVRRSDTPTFILAVDATSVFLFRDPGNVMQVHSMIVS